MNRTQWHKNLENMVVESTTGFIVRRRDHPDLSNIQVRVTTRLEKSRPFSLKYMENYFAIRFVFKSPCEVTSTKTPRRQTDSSIYSFFFYLLGPTY